jgi:hypothetical protein
MKNSIFLPLITGAVLCFCVFATNAQSDRKYNKEMEKVYKQKTKELKKEGWKVTGTSLTSDLLLDGNWRLLNITKNGSTFKLYIDGVYYANSTNSDTWNENVPLFIGNGFIGKMDNFRACNRELTAAEITEIYNVKQ